MISHLFWILVMGRKNTNYSEKNKGIQDKCLKWKKWIFLLNQLITRNKFWLSNVRIRISKKIWSTNISRTKLIHLLDTMSYSKGSRYPSDTSWNNQINESLLVDKSHTNIMTLFLKTHYLIPPLKICYWSWENHTSYSTVTFVSSKLLLLLSSKAN